MSIPAEASPACNGLAASPWRRVSCGRPCPICEKPDWCLISADGSAAICARTESPNRRGEAGWLHLLRDDRPPPRRPARTFILAPAPAPRPDLAQLSARCQSALNPTRLAALASSLGLSADSLRRLGIGWSAAHRAWSFPMRDPAGNVLGIRLRRPDGRKFAVRGSHDGLFLPADDQGAGWLLVCEGPTDAAALLDLGFAGVAGRPSCSGGLRLLVELVHLRHPAAVVIVADNDDPGRRGAHRLAAVLVVYAPAVRVITPPDGLKDARAWLQAGATRQDVEQLIQAAPPRRLAVQTREVRRDR